MNTSDSRPGTQVIAERLKVSKRKDGGVCVFRLGGSVDGRDCHVNRDIWSPVAVKIQRRGRGADGEGRTAGHKSRWHFTSYRPEFTTYRQSRHPWND